MIKFPIKLGILLLAAVSAGVLWQQAQLSVLALSRIDPLPETRMMIAEERYAEAADYLEFFMNYEYVNQNPEVRALYREISDKRRSWEYQASKLAEGLLAGTSDETIGKVTGVATDFLVIGDLRDLAQQGYNLAKGEETDAVIAALATIGVIASGAQIVSVAGTAATAGAAAPAAIGTTAAKNGLVVLKVARKLGKLPSWLGKAIVDSVKIINKTKSLDTLSDILGNEDHLGDMDFKVAGTNDGITGFQMDIKIQGISFEIMENALHQAKEGRMHILGKMNEAIDKSRENLSPYAPRLITMSIAQDQIGLVIGPGGKTIQGMQRLFGVDINIDDDGTIHIASPNRESAQQAKDYIKKLTATPEVGEVYDGVVTKIADFGAFVEILPGKEGLLHISEIDLKRVNKVSDYLKVGDKLTVKLLKIENGKFSLSRKKLLMEAAEKEAKKNQQAEQPAN